MSILYIMFILLSDLNISSCTHIVILSTGTISWEANTKHGSLPWRTVDLNRSPRALDDIGRHRQPEAHPLAVLLGSKEWLKDTTKVFWWNTTTCICDADTESTCLAGGFA